MKKIRSESGLQLITRLEEKSSLAPLFAPISSEALPQAGDCVEVSGGEGAGKSAILCSWIVKALLPASVGGCDLEVYFLDNDRKFSIVRMSILLEDEVSSVLKRRHSGCLDNVEEISTSTAKAALKNLIVLSCDSPWEMAVSLRRVLDILKQEKQSRSRLLVIDSLSAFFFIEKQCSLDQRRAFEELQLCWCTALDKLMKNFGVTIIASKLSLLSKGTRKAGDSRFIEAMSTAWVRLVTHKFEVVDGRLVLLLREKQKFVTHSELQMKIFGEGMIHLK